MGYTTEFEGRFELDRPLSSEHRLYLAAFCETRRMKRDSIRAQSLRDDLRAAVKLSIGIEGGYFVGSAVDGSYGQSEDNSIVAYNDPPTGQPGLWCQWSPSEDGSFIQWNRAEKFYHYVEWLEYIIGHFLAPWGYKLNGQVIWQGEETSDRGLLVVSDNTVVAGETALEVFAHAGKLR